MRLRRTRRYPNVMDDATVPFIRDFLAVDEEQQGKCILLLVTGSIV